MKGYKGFDKDLTCLGKQYKVAETFTEDKAELCKCGIHFCKDPLDVLDYYPPIDGNRYCRVEAEKVLRDRSTDTKRVCKKLTVKEEINLKTLIDEGIDYIDKHKRKCVPDIRKIASISDDLQIANKSVDTHISSAGKRVRLVSSGGYASISAAGDQSTLITSGNNSYMSSSGSYNILIGVGDSIKLASSASSNVLLTIEDSCSLASSGFESVLKSDGTLTNLASSGSFSSIKSSGSHCNAVASGSDNHIQMDGDYSNAATVNKRSDVIVSGKHSVGCAIGENSMCRGGIGSFLGLVEYGTDEENNSIPIHAKFIRIDGKRYKPDIWYKLEDGKVVPVNFTKNDISDGA